MTRIDVPGCKCDERTTEQLDRCDVCPVCVSYFDLGRGPAATEDVPKCPECLGTGFERRQCIRCGLWRCEPFTPGGVCATCETPTKPSLDAYEVAAKECTRAELERFYVETLRVREAKP